MTLLLLYWEFLKTGLFAVGGGMAQLPFLSDMGLRRPDWFSPEGLADMVAVSEAMPGPLGIDMATYIGYTVAGLPGVLAAVLGVITPAVVIVTAAAKFLSRYMDNQYAKRVFSGLRPAVAGLIAAACLTLLRPAVLTGAPFAGLGKIFAFPDWRCLLILSIFIALMHIKHVKKLNPMLFITAGAALGIIFKL